MDLELLEILAVVKRLRAKCEKAIAADEPKVRAESDKLALVFIRVENIIEKQHRHIQFLEIEMGKAADAINQLETAASSQATALANAQANALDSADQTAIAGVPAFIAGLTPGATPGASNTGSGSSVTQGGSNAATGDTAPETGGGSNGSSGSNS